MDIETGIVEGSFPRRALTAIMEWSELNREALQENWSLARAELPLKRIPPVE